MRKYHDLSGMTFGRLTAIHPTRTNGGKFAWLCKCSCGKERVVRTADLTNGHTQSCGCLLQERVRTHGLSNTDPYDAWLGMIHRCTRPNNKDYARYGGRGITVCDEWLEYSNFYKWAISRGYTKGLTIDRIDNDSGYSPENCRLATNLEQQRNRRNSIKITYKGERLTLKEFSERHHISYYTAYWRYRNNRDILTGGAI